MRMVETYCYSSAHFLPTFPDGHKCRRVHGHTYEVEVVIEVPDTDGYAFDHAEIDRVADVVKRLDHRLINEIEGLEDGLAETQLFWIRRRMGPVVAELGGTLVELHLDEWSSGGCSRMVRHRKSWVM